MEKWHLERQVQKRHQMTTLSRSHSHFFQLKKWGSQVVDCDNLVADSTGSGAVLVPVHGSPSPQL